MASNFKEDHMKRIITLILGLTLMPSIFGMENKIDYRHQFYDNKPPKFGEKITKMDFDRYVKTPDHLHEIKELTKWIKDHQINEYQKKSMGDNFEDANKDQLNESFKFLLQHMGNQAATQQILDAGETKLADVENLENKYRIINATNQLEETISTRQKTWTIRSLLLTCLGIGSLFYDPITPFFPGFEKIKKYIAGGLIGLGSITGLGAYKRYQNELDTLKSLDEIGSRDTYNNESKQWERLPYKEPITWLKRFIEINKPKN